MKTILKISTFLILIASTSAVKAQKIQKDTTICFRVSMDCMACKTKIEKNIAFEKGVKALDVNLADKTVKVKFNKTKNTSDKLKTAIEKLDYKVELLNDLEKSN